MSDTEKEYDPKDVKDDGPEDTEEEDMDDTENEVTTGSTAGDSAAATDKEPGETTHEGPPIENSGVTNDDAQEKSGEGDPKVKPDGEQGTRSSGRTRQLTEKGKEHTLQLKQKAFRNALSQWKRSATDIEVSIAEAETTEQLRTLRPVAEQVISAVSDAYAELDVVDPDNEADFRKLDSAQEHYSKIGTLISERHKDINLEIRSTRSSVSRASRKSKRSTKSSSASSRVKAASAASDAASLQIRLQTLQEENAKKIQIAKLTGELEELQTRRELETAKAKVRAIEEYEDLERRSDFLDDLDAPPMDIVDRYLDSFVAQPDKLPEENSRDPAPQTRRSLNPEATEFRPQNTTGDLVVAMQGFAEQVALSRLPPPEPEIFTGDPLRYPAWKASFQTLIDRKRIPPDEKMFYLTKYLEGDALKAVNGFILTAGDEQSYIQAKKVLDKRYGDSFLVANAFRNQLNEWPKIASKDGPGLQSFTDILNQCLTAMRTLEGLQILDDSHENQKLVQKLPEWMVHRWSRIVADHRQREGKFPKFEMFVRFLEKETLIANDPVFATRNSNAIKKKPTVKEDRRSRCLSTQKSDGKEKSDRKEQLDQKKSDRKDTPEKSADNSTKKSEKSETNCYFCDKSHDLDLCSAFTNATYEDKKTFMLKNGLCYRCLERGHIAKGCKNSKKCRKCERRHPTAFHKEVPAEKEASTEMAVSHLTKSGSSSKATMIVPVWVFHKNDMANKRLVYAMLDTQSDTTFVTEETCEELGITGVSTRLKLSTMSSTNEVIASQRINGLRICGFSETEDIQLPTVYTRESIPVNRSHIPTGRIAQNWKHLEPISRNMPQSTLNINVGLLIGYNCARALAPLEVIVGDCCEPYGQRTPLGWSIVGVTERETSDDFGGVCHRLSAAETLKKNENSGSTLSFRPAVKEVICPQQVIRTLERDFAEDVTGKPYSFEDIKFLKILDEGVRIRKDGHYEMPLPMKEFPVLQNNFKTALQRTKKLQPKLERDEQFREHYVTFMNNMIEQGYAEPAPKQTSSEVWYIPHHGVYHPRKPHKIRVVFDASAMHKGVCLNKRLLQGPDLTNNLIGVLCRFRKEPVAVMCGLGLLYE